MKRYVEMYWSPCPRHSKDKEFGGCPDCAENIKTNIMMRALQEAKKPIKSCLTWPVSTWKWFLQTGKMKELHCNKPDEGDVDVLLWERGYQRTRKNFAPTYQFPSDCCWEHALETWKRSVADWNIDNMIEGVA